MDDHGIIHHKVLSCFKMKKKNSRFKHWGVLTYKQFINLCFYDLRESFANFYTSL